MDLATSEVIRHILTHFTASDLTAYYSSIELSEKSDSIDDLMGECEMDALTETVRS